MGGAQDRCTAQSCPPIRTNSSQLGIEANVKQPLAYGACRVVGLTSVTFRKYVNAVVAADATFAFLVLTVAWTAIAAIVVASGVVILCTVSKTAKQQWLVSCA